VSTAAVGCATTNTKHHGLGAGQWEARLPTTASPIDELAYGKGGSSEPADSSLDGLDDPNAVLALATPAPLAKLAPHKAQHRVLPKAKLALASQPAAAATPEPVAAPAPQPMAAQPVLLAQNDSASRYAAREQRAQKQQDFRGGDAIVITAGTLVVILLIVILILLLVR
jgi:hypothetical protein